MLRYHVEQNLIKNQVGILSALKCKQTGIPGYSLIPVKEKQDVVVAHNISNKVFSNKPWLVMSHKIEHEVDGTHKACVGTSGEKAASHACALESGTISHTSTV